MENNEPQSQPPHNQADAAAKIEQVFRSMGDAMLALSAEQDTIKSALSAVIQNQNAQVQLVERLIGQLDTVTNAQDGAAAAIKATGNLLQAMDQRIQLLTTFADCHHKLFIAHGWAKPLPEGNTNLVN